jgi:hypothetical protein
MPVSIFLTPACRKELLYSAVFLVAGSVHSLFKFTFTAKSSLITDRAESIQKSYILHLLNTISVENNSLGEVRGDLALLCNVIVWSVTKRYILYRVRDLPERTHGVALAKSDLQRSTMDFMEFHELFVRIM